MVNALVAFLSLVPQSSPGKPVEIPFRIGADAIIVDAAINGKMATFMFDTGFAGLIVMNDSINIGKPTGEVNLQDFVGTFTAKTVKIKSMKMGDYLVDSPEKEAVQQSMEHLSDSYNTHTDGIMGLSVFANQILEINFQKSKFVVHPKSLDISQRKPDGVNTFLLKMLPLGNNSIELSAEMPTGEKMHLALDTGNAFYATTHKDVLERTGMWTPGKKVDFMGTSWVASGPVNSFDLHMKDIKIFGVPVQSSVWSIIDLPASGAENDGTVGFGFLKNFNITVDLPRRRVWLEKFGKDVDVQPEGEPGVIAVYEPSLKRAKIYQVVPGSPAAKAGIRAGDDLLSVDRNPEFGTTFREIDKRLKGAAGSEVLLSISRAGLLTTYTIKRDVLVNVTTNKKS